MCTQGAHLRILQLNSRTTEWRWCNKIHGCSLNTSNIKTQSFETD